MSNFHNKQTGSQVHKPNNFENANTESILIKTAGGDEGNVGYVTRTYSASTVIICLNDNSGSLHNQYFTSYAKDGNQKYCYSFFVEGQTATFVAPDNCISIKIGIVVNATATTIAAAIKSALVSVENCVYSTTTVSNDTLTITYTARKSMNFDNLTDFATPVTTITEPTVDQILISDIDDSGKLKFTDLNEAVQDIVGVMFTGNTETNITATYQDSDGTIDLVASAGAIALTTTGTSGAATLTDGTLNIPQYSGEGGDITSVTLAGDSGTASDLTTDVNLKIAGGTGITTTANETTVTIALTEDKKSKEDIDSLTGVAGNNLGTFTGFVTNSSTIKAVIQEIVTRVEAIIGVSTANLGEFTGTVISAEKNIKEAMQELETFADNIITRINALLGGETGNDLGTFTGGTIGDEKDVKAALQDLETKVEKEASTTVKGIARFNSDDFSVASGVVSNKKSIHHEHIRWETNNLDASGSNSGEGNIGFTFLGEHNNKGGLISTQCDTEALDYATALRGSVEFKLAGIGLKLLAGAVYHSGESTEDYRISLWKCDLDNTHSPDSTANCPNTLIAYADIAGTANQQPRLTPLTLVSDAVTLADSESVFIMLENTDATDLDARGLINMRFETTY